MNVIEIFAKFIVDTNDLDRGLDEAEKKAEGAGGALSSVGKGLVGLGKAGAAAISATTTATVALAKQATDAYGEFQQLEGGIQTLFSDMSGHISKIGNEAFANLSDEAWESMGEQLFSSVSENARAALDDVGSSMDLIGDAMSFGIGTASENVEGFTDYMVQKLGWSAEQANDIYASMSEVIKNNADQLGDYQAKLADFTDPSGTVMANAAKAYQTAGMSANDYMNTVIGMAASLNKSTGDVEESARLADLAIIDMSDNVNKMGTSMESVQNAYRGFTRGNFTMLDNLALGYAGTKEGMQELLTAAQQISGVEYDIESYADIVNAIHVVQTEMGITGTTAKEAGDTITGSAGAMKAAWDNLVLGIANPEADLGQLITAVVGSAEVAIKNLMPIFTQALTGIGDLVKAAAPIISQELPGLVDALLPQILNAAMSLLEGITDALPDLIQIITDQTPMLIDAIKMILDALMQTLPSLMSAFTNAIPPLIQAVISIILENAPALLQAVFDLISQLGEAVAEMLPTLIPEVVSLITQILQVLTDPANIAAVLQAGVDIINGLFTGLEAALPGFLDAVGDVVINLVDAFVNGLPILIDGAISLVTGLVNQLPTIIRKLTEKIPQIIRSIVSALTQTLPVLIQGVISLVNALVQALPEIISALIEALPEIVSAVVDALVVSLPLLIHGLVDLVIALVDALPEIMYAFIDAMPTVLEMIINTLMENLPILIEGIIELQTALWDHFPEIMRVLFDLIPPMFESLVVQLTQNLPILLAGVVEILGVIGKSLVDGVGTIFNKVTGAIGTWWSGLKSDISGAFELFMVDFLQWLEKLPYNLGVFLGQMITKIIEWKNDVMDWIRSDLPLIIDGFINWFKDLPTNIGQFFTDIYDNIMQWAADMIVMVQDEVPKIIDEIARFFEELPEKALEWGADMISGFVDGVNSMWDEGIDSIRNFAQGIADNIGFSVPKEGPLSRADEFAPDMMDLFAKGIEDNTDVVRDAVTDAFDFKKQIMSGRISAGGAGGLLTPTAGQDLTVVLQLNEEQLGRVVYRLNNDQVQRVGVNLEGMVSA